MFFGAFLLLTKVGYSDGDDAFFYQYTHEMGFFEYLSWRYQKITAYYCNRLARQKIFCPDTRCLCCFHAAAGA